MNSHQLHRWKPILCLLLLLAACTAPDSVANTPSIDPDNLPLTPYWTPEPSNTPLPGQSAPLPATPSPLPSPSATPFTYRVEQGDTMLGIAFQHGISLEDLQAANPDVDPNFISVDTVLTIPLQIGEPTVVPTPTPWQTVLQTPRCYVTAEGDFHCLAGVMNNQDRALENVSAWFHFLGPDGERIASAQAFLPLNLLAPQGTLPLVARFEPPLPGGIEALSPQVELLTAVGVAPYDARYLPAEVSVQESEIAETGLLATVRGEVTLLEPPPPPVTPTLTAQATASLSPAIATATAMAANAATATASAAPPAPGALWLAAVAYAQDGQIVGVRKWEANLPIRPGDRVPFEITVYTLGSAIQRVEVLSEARP